MNSPQCSKVQNSFSAYLDGAVSGKQMRSIADHLDACEGCREEFDGLRAMQRSLAMLGPAKAPADLAMRLRLAISHEAAEKKSNWRDRLELKWENTIRPFVVQVSAGAACSVVLVGSIMIGLGLFAAPQPVMANDEPLGAMTAPHYLYSAVMPRPIVTNHDSAIIVEAMVNDRGQVYDYKIVSGPEDATVQNQVVDQLMLSVFEPAKVFGAPVRGRVVMTFSGISVQG
jgi:hypothetical protein